MKILKWPLPAENEFLLPLAPGESVLTVEVQYNQACAWCLHHDFNAADPSLAGRRFRVVGTGAYFDGDHWRHVATWQDKPFVWHLLEDARDG